MICFLDKSFCDNSVCRVTDCDRKYTEDIQKRAEKEGLPVALIDFGSRCAVKAMSEATDRASKAFIFHDADVAGKIYKSVLSVLLNVPRCSVRPHLGAMLGPQTPYVMKAPIQHFGL